MNYDERVAYMAKARAKRNKINKLNARIEKETREQYQDYLEAKYEYQDWLRANDCTAIVPTYWHGRVLRATSTMPTYRSAINAEPQNSFQQYAAIVECIENNSQTAADRMNLDMMQAATDYWIWLTCNDLKQRRSDIPQTVAWTLQTIRYQEMRNYQEMKS